LLIAKSLRWDSSVLERLHASTIYTPRQLSGRALRASSGHTTFIIKDSQVTKASTKQNQNPLAVLFGEDADGQDETINEHARQITNAWNDEQQARHQTLDGIFRQAKLCTAAYPELPGEEKQELVEQLPFDVIRFMKLVMVGRDERLQRAEVRALLPPHHNTLFELAKLSDDELEQAMAAKVVHPEMRRAQLTAWLNSRGDKGRNEDQGDVIALPNGIHWAIRFPADKPNDDLVDFDQRLQEFCAEHGAPSCAF
jgi:hypothetical protein